MTRRAICTLAPTTTPKAFASVGKLCSLHASVECSFGATYKIHVVLDGHDASSDVLGRVAHNRN